MLGLLRRKTELLAKVPIPASGDSFEDVREEYNRVATKLGIQQRIDHPTVTSRLRTALTELSLSVYDQSAVEQYMDKKGQWTWNPLKECGSDVEIPRVTPHDYPTIYGGTSWHRIYTDPVPLPVLLTAEQILSRCSSARFFVAAIDKDPFLGVLLKSSHPEFYIVERWNEPSFRG